jgi:type I restriction enzyme S subunit
MSKWILKEMNELGYTYTGLSGKKKEDFGVGKPYITYMNVLKNYKLDYNSIDYVNVGEYEKQNVVLQGDAIFTTSSETPEEVGLSSVATQEIDYSIFLNSFCFGFRLKNKKEINPDYFACILRGNSFRYQMYIAAQGSTRYNLSKRNFNKSFIEYPENIKEQEKIAEIIATVDISIENTKALIEKYINMKSGLLQDLLTNGIDKNGDIRSPKTHEYKDSPLGRIPVDWECIELDDLVKICQGLQISINKRYTNNFDNKFYQYITVDYLNSGKSEYYVAKQKNTVHCERKDILMTRTGNTGVVITNVSGVFHNNFFKVIYNDKQITKEYLYFYLDREHIKEYFKNISGTTTIPDLKHKDFLKTKIIIPKTTDEQEVIVEKLNSIDEIIDTEKKYLIKLETTKKGLMQDLLTNKVPVNCLL